MKELTEGNFQKLAALEEAYYQRRYEETEKTFAGKEKLHTDGFTALGEGIKPMGYTKPYFHPDDFGLLNRLSELDPGEDLDFARTCILIAEQGKLRYKK